MSNSNICARLRIEPTVPLKPVKNWNLLRMTNKWNGNSKHMLNNCKIRIFISLSSFDAFVLLPRIIYHSLYGKFMHNLVLSVCEVFAVVESSNPQHTRGSFFYLSTTKFHGCNRIWIWRYHRYSQNKLRMNWFAIATRLLVANRVTWFPVLLLYGVIRNQTIDEHPHPVQRKQHEVEIRQLKPSTQNRVR